MDEIEKFFSALVDDPKWESEMSHDTSLPKVRSERQARKSINVLWVGNSLMCVRVAATPVTVAQNMMVAVGVLRTCVQTGRA